MQGKAVLFVALVALGCLGAPVQAQSRGGPGPFSDKTAASQVGWPAGSGSGLLDGNDHFHIVNSGPCAINEARLHKYASSLSASPNIMAVGGDHGKAVAECISGSCDSMPRITFDWDLQVEDTGMVAGGGKGPHPGRNNTNLTDNVERSWPRCERGLWRPIMPTTVHVSVFQNNVAFAAAGCLELQGMDLETQEWMYTASLPRSLTLQTPAGAKRKGGTLKPEFFGSRVALGNGLAVATAALDAPGNPPIVVVFTLLGASWEQVDVLECPFGDSAAGCACPAGESSPRSSCFGAAVAVHGSRLAVGNPGNGTVVLYEQASGTPLQWNAALTLTSTFDTLSASMFGASLSLGDTLLVVGAPSSGAGARAAMYNVVKGAEGYGSLVYDTVDRCCKLGLPCCISGLVGTATALAEYAEEAAAVVGDPRSAQVHVVRCNTTALRWGPATPEGGGGPSASRRSPCRAPPRPDRTPWRSELMGLAAALRMAVR